MTIQVLRPSLYWLHVQADQPFYVPRQILDVPGVRYLTPDPGYNEHRCEFPFTSWHLPQVREWLMAFGCDPTTIQLHQWPRLADGPQGRPLFEHQHHAVD